MWLLSSAVVFGLLLVVAVLVGATDVAAAREARALSWKLAYTVLPVNDQAALAKLHRDATGSTRERCVACHGDKQDSSLEGDAREGRTEAYDTNLSGLGAQNPSRLPYLDLFSQYRKQMEETLTKEPIPFSYREQVKEYFKALEPR